MPSPVEPPAVQRKTYMSYPMDRAALAKVVAHGRKKNSRFSEGDGMRQAIINEAARIK